MNVLFYHSGEYKENYTPEQLTEEIWAAYINVFDNVFQLKFQCIVDFEYPQKMSIRIIEPDGVPYCTIHINYKEYDILKYLCEKYVTFESSLLELEGE
jgi:hypothetical protein